MGPHCAKRRCGACASAAPSAAGLRPPPGTSSSKATPKAISSLLRQTAASSSGNSTPRTEFWRHRPPAAVQENGRADLRRAELQGRSRTRCDRGAHLRPAMPDLPRRGCNCGRLSAGPTQVVHTGEQHGGCQDRERRRIPTPWDAQVRGTERSRFVGTATPYPPASRSCTKAVNRGWQSHPPICSSSSAVLTARRTNHKASISLLASHAPL